MMEHGLGHGANHTKKHTPLRLANVEEFERIEDAYYREKQIQNWSHKKKQALIEKNIDELHKLAKCQNETKADGRTKKNSAIV